MYFLVKLHTSNNDKIIVPLKWIRKINLVRLLNYGMPIHRKKHVIVYFVNSKHFDTEPDFHVNVQQNFDYNRSACYNATILRGFGRVHYKIYLKLLRTN